MAARTGTSMGAVLTLTVLFAAVVSNWPLAGRTSTVLPALTLVVCSTLAPVAMLMAMTELV